MLIHLVPRFLTCPASGPHVQLINLRIDSVGLLLRDRVDLATRRPMPNKRMAIGCSKRGRMARVGLLIDTLQPAKPFTVVYRWAVAAEQVIVHRVHYELLGEPGAYKVVSDKMATWPQRPTEHQHSIPTFVQPRLEATCLVPHDKVVNQRVGSNGLLLEREESFQVPLLERGDWFKRLYDSLCHRAPRLADVVTCPLGTASQGGDPYPFAGGED
ncbi:MULTISPECIES: DUF6012 family protein [Pseudomonas]|uniref:Uncharacterized protein n=1 Tax=Pseudomonas oryzihabitans TaxID=47885 RepID=A0A178LL93_9PSED|nr:MULTISPECIES: DUF6012 family protein [Pseudomonas]NRH44490.1 hypothetical protein [Pseudomonas sp. MS15a(2019)]OAN31691.1 hypothetical protein A4V15_11560 [Pseudomonas oryzihabitans]